MVITVIIFSILFLVLAILTFFKPQKIVKLVSRAEIRWSLDKELFSTSKVVRICVGSTFLLAAVVLFYAAYRISR